MTWADYVIILIVAVSALISLLRGFLREVVSLITWVVGFWVALRFAHQAGDVFSIIHNPSIRLMLGFVVLFVIVLIIGALVGWLIGKLVQRTGVSASDRILGLIFGLVRGAVIVVVLVTLARFTDMPKDSWWQQSRLIPYAESAAGWMRGVLPERVSNEMMRGLRRAADAGHGR